MMTHSLGSHFRSEDLVELQEAKDTRLKHHMPFLVTNVSEFIKKKKNVHEV